MLKGIAVSEKRKWDKIKNRVSFVLLCMDDLTAFYSNVKECENLKIPYAAYFSSNAQTIQQAKEEALRTVENLKEYKPFAVFGKYINISHRIIGPIALTHLICAYIDVLKGAGYNAGIFSSSYYLDNCIVLERLRQKSGLIWCGDIAEGFDINQETDGSLIMSEEVLGIEKPMLA